MPARSIAIAALLLVFASVAAASAPSGAIFTTVANGSEVNYNIYAFKTDVYLDGGPGPGAPKTAAGLDDGVYVFQVTNPSGKILLSTDAAVCRQFVVVDGIIDHYVTDPRCTTAPHVTGLDIDHGATTIQLMPYNDTPNPGGEYKVWATMTVDFACSLTGPDCGTGGGVGFHGFIPRHSKTDNYKVRGTPLEIDTRFFDADGYFIDGLGITHFDPLGGSDVKWSYLNTALDINHEAHVEAVEQGTHEIRIANQVGCIIGMVTVAGVPQHKAGPQTVKVNITASSPITTFIDVYCQ